ncbi:MAG: winged helix-turn-helix domain-containing protein, partial [Sandarakinorhabdus sp.]|nr:winged helix-turn-helix domain-containing protein [Sandarakinorhabdus sp.]
MNDPEQIDLAHAAPFRLGPLVVEPGLRQVVDAAGASETIEPRVMQVLVVLAMANGGIVSRDDLVRKCWEGRIVGDDSINRVIARLRKLADDPGAGGFHIETITKVGYRLIGPVELVASQQPGPLTRRPPAESPLEPAAPGPAKSSPAPILAPPAPQPLFAAESSTAGPVAAPARTPPALDRRLVIGGGAPLAIAGSAIAWRGGLFGTAAKVANSVAVIPFANLGGAPDEDYFSDGLSAEIRAELARNPRLEVTAQASSNKFRASKDDAKAISQALGVAFLLDGNVRRSGDTVRVSAELVDGRSGFSQWSQTFDRPLSDVFAVQREIPAAIAVALNAEVGQDDAGQARGPGALGGTENIIAFDAFLQGKALFEQGIDEA